MGDFLDCDKKGVIFLHHALVLWIHCAPARSPHSLRSPRCCSATRAAGRHWGPLCASSSHVIVFRSFAIFFGFSASSNPSMISFSPLIQPWGYCCGLSGVCSAALLYLAVGAEYAELPLRGPCMQSHLIKFGAVCRYTWGQGTCQTHLMLIDHASLFKAGDL